MIEFLSSLDRSLFQFLNQTLSNPVGDLLWPILTDYDRILPVRIVLAAVWLWLVIRGGRRGRTVAFLIIPILFLSDQLSSSLLKNLFGRPRPCQTVQGVPVFQTIHLLVNCGTGKSFPSSHAVNNFAAATAFSFYFRKWAWAFLGWASLIALSRPAVGVHYPSDILGGAIFGAFLAALVIWIWEITGGRMFSPPDSAQKTGSSIDP
jgi:undecaprenyl-diphosphatase